jgi:hypothetical protein
VQENSSTNNHKAYFDYHLLALAIATNNSTVMNQVAGRSGSLIEKQVCWIVDEQQRLFYALTTGLGHWPTLARNVPNEK